MHFFDHYPDKIFVPLGSQNRRRYLDLIIELHDTFFSEYADFLETSISISKIKDFIEGYIQDQSWSVEEDHDFELRTVEQLKASTNYIYFVLRKSGWISVRKDGVKKEAYMSPRISILVDFLQNAQSYGTGEVGGDVLAIYNAINFLMTSKGATVIDLAQTLTKTTKDSRNLGKQMKNLALHLTDISQDFKSYVKLKDKVKLFFEGFIQGSSFSDYNAIKGHNHPFRYRTEIIEKLFEIEHTPEIRNRLIEAISEHENLLKQDAEEKLIKNIHLIRSVFQNTEHLITKIDISHDRLLRQVNESIKYQRRTPTNAGQLFEEAISLLKEVDDGQVIDSPLPVFKAVSSDSVGRIPRKRPPIKQEAVSLSSAIPEEQKARIQARRDYAERVSLSDQKFLAWLNALFSENYPKVQITSQEVLITEVEDLIGFSNARRLAMEPGKLHSRYRKSLSQYEFTRKSVGLIQHEYMLCNAFTITKKENSAHV
ncbi:hypothetical protein J3998_07895 [Thiomicrorhabdus sp. 6S2-11]|uniref:Uncharacterized protein n=1 Tax=Thiomicrorhabdus marina TaxID=2818442 RepID=A0ABS3Q5R2_9GAMM|nr:Wadjet anti-phage system protein JetA family protein [Thiomicrorhabdus marina]MBO1927498.1 hypothetical protein [Thiomicrorhabdus marina]